VANALKVTLLDNPSEQVEAGGTRNPEALNAYLRARKAEVTANDAPATLAAIDLYDEAIRLDPNYARAIAFRSGALVDYAVSFAIGSALKKEFLARGESDARHAIALAPRLADGHVALAWYHRQALELRLADREYRDTVALAPGNAEVLLGSGQFAIRMGRTEEGLAAIRRAVELDPVNERARLDLGLALWSVRRYHEAATELDAVLGLNPHDNNALGYRGFTSYMTGDLEAARASCERGSRAAAVILVCQAVTYGRIGRRTDAAAALAAIKSAFGDAAAYQYMQIYAQWGDVPRALEWLEKALQLKDSGLEKMKIDPLLDPLRNEPRFQAVMRELNFPE
jgi:tetratricopeptide (TPR) repeat protein